MMSAISVTVLEGSRMAVNSRITRVDQSSLLEDVLVLVSSEDDINRLASVQAGLDAGSCDTMQDRPTSPRVWQTAFRFSFEIFPRM